MILCVDAPGSVKGLAIPTRRVQARHVALRACGRRHPLGATKTRRASCAGLCPPILTLLFSLKSALMKFRTKNSLLKNSQIPYGHEPARPEWKPSRGPWPTRPAQCPVWIWMWACNTLSNKGLSCNHAKSGAMPTRPPTALSVYASTARKLTKLVNLALCRPT